MLIVSVRPPVAIGPRPGLPVTHAGQGPPPTPDASVPSTSNAGNDGVILLADKRLASHKHGVLIPGPQAHAMKLAFEKYFL